MGWIFLVVLFLQLSFCTGNEASVENLGSSTTLDSGQKLELKCHPDNATEYQWSFQTTAVGGSSALIPGADMQVYNKTVSRNDDGFYMCQVNGNSTTLSDQLRIIVNYLENAILTVNPTTPTEGDTTTLTCDVTTNLQPEAVTYIFIKNGGSIQTETENTFSFNKISKSDDGNYSCIAQARSLQVSSDDVIISVQELFPKPSLSYTGSMDSGSQSTLSCSVNTVLSPVEYKFSKNQTNLTSYQAAPALTIANLQTTNDGTYTCTVKINDIEKTSDTYDLNVQLKVSLTVNPMKEGENQTITCDVAGGETVNVKWKINDVEDATASGITYEIINVQRSMNLHSYSCTATSGNGKVSNASSTLQVYWFDKPNITLADQYPEEGANVIFTCNVNANPSPSTYKWYKEGVLIGGENAEAYSINQVSRINSGNFTCGTETTQFTTEKVSDKQLLTVLYLDQPTTTFLDGTNTPFIENEEVAIDCVAGLHYTGLSLSYVWSTGADVNVSNTQTLRLSNINRNQNGTYKCTVIGEVHGKTLRNEVEQNIIVYYLAGPLIFTNNDFEIRIGNALSIGCYSNEYGIPPAELSWYNDTSSRLIVPGKIADRVDLVVASVDRSHTGNYTCVANNTAGKASKSFYLIVTEVPDAPIDLLVQTQDSTHIVFTWNSPLFDGNKPITTYLFYHRLKGNGVFTSVDTQNQRTYNLSGLDPGKVYEVKVQAVNSIGPGVESAVVEVTTGESPPSAPKDFNAESLSQAVKLNWQVPNPTNGNITGYRVCYVRDTDDGKKVSSTETCVDVGLTLEYNVPNLGKYSGYNFTVAAQNSKGYGLNATLTVILTLAEEPTVVRNVNITASARSFLVTWNEPENIFGILLGYNVSYRESSSQPSLFCRDIMRTQCNITGLSPFREYVIIITVKNQLFSKPYQEHSKTLGVAPPPLTEVLPAPPDGSIDKTSFVIKILPFNGSNGAIRNYDVIVFELPNEQVPARKPSDYSNDEIKTNVVGRLTTLPQNQLFTVGNGVVSKRKRRALGNPNNPGLKEDTNYAVFVRGYVYDDVYTSTDWYNVVKTNSEDSTDAGLIIGIVIAIVAVLVIIILVVFFVKRKKDRKDIGRDETQLKRSMKKSFRGFSPPIQDPTIPVPPDRFEDHVNQLKANGNYGFSQEYQMISRELDFTYSNTRLTDNVNKNRYHNVPAYDDTRVLLNIMDGDKHSDYINANFIEGFHSNKEYIATQGPMPETVFDFWRMAWETEATTVVMLTRLEEKGRDKCAQYWPDSGSLSLKDMILTATEVNEFPDHVVRTFHLTRTGQAIERIVKQFHFTAWPDFGVPDDPSALLGFIRKVNNWKGMSSGPVIVHCSAGVGRTGTYITIDTQIKNIKHKKDITIFNNVQTIREQRCLMVQTEDQYVFIHFALLDYLESGDTEVEANELRDYFKRLCQVDVRTGLTGIVEEFIRLAKADRKEKFHEANKDVNQDKNRYKNVYPYDATRVKLSNRPGVDGSDYINANYIDSYASKDMFIATQGPLENTVGDFWRMIWEQNSATIVMLVKEVEGNQPRSYPYWPQTNSSKIEHFIVELVTVTTYGDYIVRDLKLTNTEASMSRDVKQFQYKTWPDSGSPESGVGIIEMIGRVQKWNAASNKIITVHCSAGVGRTGVFIALTNLIERVKTESVVDVYQTVKKMRQQRTAMVQTRDQYEFLFRALQEYLDSFDLYSNFK